MQALLLLRELDHHLLRSRKRGGLRMDARPESPKLQSMWTEECMALLLQYTNTRNTM